MSGLRCFRFSLCWLASALAFLAISGCRHEEESAAGLVPAPALVSAPNTNDAVAEADVRNCATAEQVLFAEHFFFGASEQAIFPGSGIVREQGVELAGPLPAATAAQGTQKPAAGALLSGRDRDGKVQGLGLILHRDVSLRADTSAKADSFIVYGRHKKSGRAFAMDADSMELWVCENKAWTGRAGVLALPASVTDRRNDLNGALCGGEPVPTWTRLGAVQEALEGDMNGAAKQAVRHFATTEELLFGEFQSFGVSESGTLPGSGRRRGEGTELFGPLDAGTEETAGAMISAGWGDDSSPVGLGVELGLDLYLRADTSADAKSFTVYARHKKSGLVFARDGDSPDLWVCENPAWAGRSGIQALPAPVRAGRNDLDGTECGGSPVSIWTNLWRQERRQDSAAERMALTAAAAEERLFAGHRVFGASEAAALPGAGGGQGKGTELSGPLAAASVGWNGQKTQGALLSGLDHDGKARGQGFAVGADLYLRADASAAFDSYIVYVRHRKSGRVFAKDADADRLWVCDNDAWAGQSGILALPASVTAGRNDLDGAECCSAPLRTWQLLSEEERTQSTAAMAAMQNSAATAALVALATAEEGLFIARHVFGTTQRGRLPGSGIRGKGMTLYGPLQAGTETSSGALLTSVDSNGEKTGLGLAGVGADLSVRADTSADADSYIVYARHKKSSLVFALDADAMESWVCENEAWVDHSNIPATPAPVTAGHNDLDGTECGGSPVSTWKKMQENP